MTHWGPRRERTGVSTSALLFSLFEQLISFASRPPALETRLACLPLRELWFNRHFRAGPKMPFIAHSELARRQRALRLKTISHRRSGPGTAAQFLNSMAATIEETSSRCTDPVIVSELQYAVEKLRETADELSAG